ncbi:hypothetical protein TVNIR_0956 [Thioalkalivibrio nitratireducens DSM 14787]|uniref:Uncharacterized protein n=1 Tax=Thioalkalivibrio nitratireducens (strain DSM 14787 / UNIQEM 213 / ALEN2) TaxID=1255043 RepID=L0DUD6_THIND|nr:hypothetical protein [Thioalkalivibrio nitratireducens]AGA32643.1 hypothetical protein TVNIR_0956 [Thioalkalivibrio nitratireducens DSM 14787]
MDEFLADILPGRQVHIRPATLAHSNDDRVVMHPAAHTPIPGSADDD